MLPLFFCVSRKELVLSDKRPDRIALPAFYQEDVIPIAFRAQKRISDYVDPVYQRLSLNGYALEIVIGAVGSPLARQNVWTASADGYELTGDLSLVTTEMNAALAGVSQVTTIFEVILSTASTKYRGQFPITIKKSVSLAGGLNPVVNDTGLGRLEADRLFARKEGKAGEGQILTSPDGTKQGFIYWGDDGAFHAEPIS